MTASCMGHTRMRSSVHGALQVRVHKRSSHQELMHINRSHIYQIYSVRYLT